MALNELRLAKVTNKNRKGFFSYTEPKEQAKGTTFKKSVTLETWHGQGPAPGPLLGTTTTGACTGNPGRCPPPRFPLLPQADSIS